MRSSLSSTADGRSGCRPQEIGDSEIRSGKFDMLERWNRSIKEECLSKLILFGERSLRHVLTEYTAHFHRERNHQGRENRILLPTPEDRIGKTNGAIETRERLGGVLNFYYRMAA